MQGVALRSKGPRQCRGWLSSQRAQDSAGGGTQVKRPKTVQGVALKSKGPGQCRGWHSSQKAQDSAGGGSQVRGPKTVQGVALRSAGLGQCRGRRDALPRRTARTLRGGGSALKEGKGQFSGAASSHHCHFFASQWASAVRTQASTCILWACFPSHPLLVTAHHNSAFIAPCPVRIGTGASIVRPGAAPATHQALCVAPCMQASTRARHAPRAGAAGGPARVRTRA